MYKEILEEINLYAETNFASWLRPFLSINMNSSEKVIGVRVPTLRKMAKKYATIDELDLLKLLQSNIHEHRALAIFIMLLKSKKDPKMIADLYLKNLEYINNWDLIDYSAPHIIAPHVNVEVLHQLADSDYMWANRVAMVSTIYFIKKDNYDLALDFAEKFISHKHHLMHKASGWMLREIGKRNEEVLKDFLMKHSSEMPAIMRSYATEKLRKRDCP